jgi:FtsP/CotA-like multicopper oxidase with cupredoxin domain
VFFAASTPWTAVAQTAAALPAIETHDNLKPAGTLLQGELRLSLWAGMGQWFPEGPRNAPIEVAALGEEGGPLSIPAPLIRVPLNTRIHVSVRNALKSPLRLAGFCDRPGRCDALVIPAGVTRDVRFTVSAAGAFHYWASTSPGGLAQRALADTQLGGVIIGDAPTGGARDRIFVIGMRVDGPVGAEAELAVINGRSWPHTERLTYAVGDTASWRVVNLSGTAHAMHLHGFYFNVAGTGDGATYAHHAERDRRQAVTEQVQPGGTLGMSWIPERAGNWLFHCHMLVHMMRHGEQHPAAESGHAPDDSAAGMAGLVLGVRVTGQGPAVSPAEKARRLLELSINHDTRNGEAPSYKVGLTAGGRPMPRLNDSMASGPVMVLTRGEPVSVEVVNRLDQPTAIHWHGIELESYDDGVAGFGGTPGSVTPPVAAGGRFTARFTPSRAGTFIYHTHWHDAGQLAGGVYGPIVVLEPGETYTPLRDHIILIGLDGAYRPLPNETFAVNGERRPSALTLDPGVTHRLRFINITADNVALTVQLVSRFDPIEWTLVGKDGAAIPASQRKPVKARQLVTVGETYDFELAPMAATPAGLWLELRRGNGELLLQWPVVVRQP